MLSEPMSNNEIEKAYKGYLTLAQHEGRFPPMDSGMSVEVQKALRAVAMESPSPTKESLKRAQQALSRQLEKRTVEA